MMRVGREGSKEIFVFAGKTVVGDEGATVV